MELTGQEWLARRCVRREPRGVRKEVVAQARGASRVRELQNSPSPRDLRCLCRPSLKAESALVDQIQWRFHKSMWATLASSTAQTCPHTTPESLFASKTQAIRISTAPTFEEGGREHTNAALWKIFSDNSGARVDQWDASRRIRCSVTLQLGDQKAWGPGSLAAHFPVRLTSPRLKTERAARRRTITPGRRVSPSGFPGLS